MSFPAADRADLCEPASSWQRASTSQASAPLSAGGTRRRAPRAAAQSGPPPPAKDRKTPSRRGLRPPSASTVAVPSGPTEAAAPPAAPPGGGASSCSSSPSAKLAKCASYSARRASASSVAALSSSLRFSSLASSSLSLASLSRCLLTCAFHAFETKGGLRNRTIHYCLWRIPARPRLFAALGARLFPRAPSRSFPRPCATRRTFREELTDWKAHWSRFSHFSLKSTSMPPFMSARIRSAPTSSYCGATGRRRRQEREKKEEMGKRMHRRQCRGVRTTFFRIHLTPSKT